MNAEERTRMIMSRVERARNGPVAPRWEDIVTITDRDHARVDPQGRWLARLTPRYHQVASHCSAPDGSDAKKDWGLFQLYAYDQLRVTAHYTCDDLMIRLYKSGSWENIFFTAALAKIDDILPGA